MTSSNQPRTGREGWRLKYRFVHNDDCLGQRIDGDYLTIIELTMWPCVCACVWQSTPRTADVTVTNIAGYVRVRIVMNR